MDVSESVRLRVRMAYGVHGSLSNVLAALDAERGMTFSVRGAADDKTIV